MDDGVQSSVEESVAPTAGDCASDGDESPSNIVNEESAGFEEAAPADSGAAEAPATDSDANEASFAGKASAMSPSSVGSKRSREDAELPSEAAAGEAAEAQGEDEMEAGETIRNKEEASSAELEAQ